MNVKHILALVVAVICSNVALAREGPFALIGAQLHVSERSRTGQTPHQEMRFAGGVELTSN